MVAPRCDHTVIARATFRSEQVRDGHPFETEELDRLRSSQRALLRGAPDGIIGKMAPGPGFKNLKHPADAPMVELRFRRYAQVQLEASADYFSQWLKHTGARETARLDGDIWAHRNLSAAQGLDRVTDALAEESRSSEPAEFGQVEPDSLYEVWACLVAAEELASDDYIDPRLVE